MEHW
jgi:probable 2-oxoglutarate dehydrogenase E1 component DHKTD1